MELTVNELARARLQGQLEEISDRLAAEMQAACLAYCAESGFLVHIAVEIKPTFTDIVVEPLHG